MKIINLDHISSKPLLLSVQEAMIEVIKGDYGNPSSQHVLGEKSAAALEDARESVAQLINCANPREIVFTSGGTESVNHAIKGVALAKADQGKHIVTTNIEHNAVLKSLRRLTSLGYQTTSVAVDNYGRVDPQKIAEAIRDDTILISVMHSNNEIGTIQPIEEIAEIAKAKNVLLHTDAVDSVGVVPIDVQKMGVDLLSFSANSFYGPPGSGGLYIRRGTAVWSLLDGGLQENKRRAGAENLIGIVGMGVAAKLAFSEMDSRLNHLNTLRRFLLDNLPQYLDECFVNGHPEYCLPNLISLSIKYIEGESIVLMLDEENIAVSTRSACASGALRASHVLISIGCEYTDAQGTLLIAFGIDNTKEEIVRFLEELKKAVKTLRDISPLYKT